VSSGGFSDRISTDAAIGSTTSSLPVVPVIGEYGSVLGGLAYQNRNGGFQESESAAMTCSVSLPSIAPEIERIRVLENKAVCSMSCFALDFEGIGHFKECFFFFESLLGAA
jgi:hypothetical protein